MNLAPWPSIPARSLHSWLAAAVGGLSAGCAGVQAPDGLGVEVQAYPAGIIPGVHARWELTPTDDLTARLAANLTDRQDFGEHDDETGGGGGGGLGWRRYLDPARTGWLYGARVDLWNLEIDWQDLPGQIGETTGNSNVWVLMPTIEGGYGFELSKRWHLELTTGVGAEINVATDGEDVGQGAIVLLGVTLFAR